MKIVLIVPGSGGTFYCENCLRDAGLVAALRRQGHDVTMVPMYLPFFTDTPGIAADTPVFFGGINLYLGETFPLYRHAPAWLRRAFDARWLLKLSARRGESTRAHGMGKMTLSMLQGTGGRHAAELDRLVDWLRREARPDVIHLSTALLIGLARHLRDRLGAPVTCMVQDEDTWLDALDKPYDAHCWAAIRDRLEDAGAILAASRHYAGVFARRAGIDPGRLKVVHPGIEVAGYEASGGPAAGGSRPPVVGYLSRMAESLGLGTLVEAFMLLRQQPEFGSLRLRAMGGITAPDARFVASLKAALAARGLADSADFLPELDRDSRLAFLRSLTVMSVPVPAGAAFGTFLLEAMAAGVPVVQPRCGAFPELIEATGGGMCYEPHTAAGLARALGDALRDPARLAAWGRAGRTSVQDRFTVDRMAERMIEAFRI